VTNPLEPQVRAVIVELFLGGDAAFPLGPETQLIEAGICDSMGLVQLAAALEQRFPGLRVDDQDVTHENLGSPLAIARFLERSGVDG
jgi:acyl carrier protein